MTLKQRLNLPFLIIGLLFFVIGFAIGINGFLVPYLKGAFQLTTAQSYLVLTATFSAFVIFGMPSGYLIKKIGYKKGMMISFFIIGLGMLLFVPAANHQSFVTFLLALFIGGMGNTLLQTAVNPYITIVGPEESAAMRISIMGIVNKAAAALGPIFLGLFLNLKNVQLNDIIFPFYLITTIFFVLGLCSYFMPLPEIKAKGEEETDEDTTFTDKTSVFQFPHLLLGVMAIFLYVGIENLALYSIIDFADKSGLANPQVYTSYTTAFMIAGYLIGVFFIPKLISQQTALKSCAWLGLIITPIVVFVPAQIAVYAIAILGLANSLMWPAIWPLAIADLGKFTKLGASLLVMGIVGGALIPLLFGWMTDLFQSHQMAYSICVPAYLFILYFGVKGHKIR